jgi:hypothetical protein
MLNGEITLSDLIFTAITEPLLTHVKAAAAICVAGEIFEQAMKRPPSAGKLVRTKIAGDALDKTAPGGAIAAKYPSKPEDQSDVQFLLQNLTDIAVPGPDYWPPRKVAPTDWAEYTRVMRGLELFLKRGGQGAAFSKLERADVSGMLSFIAPQLKHVPDAVVVSVLTA